MKHILAAIALILAFSLAGCTIEHSYVKDPKFPDPSGIGAAMPEPVEEAPQEPEPVQEAALEPSEEEPEESYVSDTGWDGYEEESYYECYDEATAGSGFEWYEGMDVDSFKACGVVEYGDWTYTWYSESVLPGGGLDELNSNGRHVEDGLVKDGDGYIAVASSDLPQGTVVETPLGEGKVYDCGAAPGIIDVYTE